MLFIIYVVGFILTLYTDALCCVSVGHKFNLKASCVAAIFWVVSVPLIIYAAYKHDAEQSNTEGKP